MATIIPDTTEIDYPTSDGRPMAETDWHRDLMLDLIGTLKWHFAPEPKVYVSGNLLVFYEPGNRRRHLAPDVFVVKGVPKHDRPYYLIWQEGKTLDAAIELTSSSTKEEDIEDKFWLYRDILKVQEYFLFDPQGEYLDPPSRGYRLKDGEYVPIEPVNGRLPSEVLGLQLEAHGKELRLYDPRTGQWLPTLAERAAQAEAARELAERERKKAEQDRQQAEMGQAEAEAARKQADRDRQQAEAETERLRRELEELRRKLAEG